MITELKDLYPKLTIDTPFSMIVKKVGETKVAEVIAKHEDINNYNLHKKEIVKQTIKPEIKKETVKPKVAEVVKPTITTNENPSTTQELKDLILSDISTGQKVQTITNGIKKNLIQEPMANIESWFDEHFSDKVEYPDASISKAKKEAALEKIKTLKDKTYALKKQIDTDNYFKNLPDLKQEDFYNLDKLEFSYRNKRNTNPITSRGIILQTINPIQEDKSKLNYNPKSQQIIALNKTTGKIEFPSNKEELKDNSAYTIANKYKVTDFNGFDKIKDEKNGTGTWFPTLLDKNGNKITYHVGASMNDNNRNEGLYGGKLLVISEDGKHKQLFVGSVAKLQKDFYNFKNKTNSEEVTIVQLDEGSYNKPRLPYRYDNKISKKELEDYDAQNVVGGHAFYIKN